ncbi:hypothetical protein [Novosphingobium clariflavum]|uniref:Uncharacterized protein n=1 Tax=Novosphingobium clariflavum TaxID=2029884 RepID=A0ABV6S5M5_9SPHN|nr:MULTISPECIES: hypothetical protein [Novosphingobium]
MALNWKAALKPVSQSKEFKPGNAGGMSASARTAAGMDKALAAYKGGNKDVKRATIIKKGDEVKFSVRYANQALKLDGKDGEFVVPADKFEEIYGAIKAAVLAGEFDSQLAPLEANSKQRGAKMVAAKAAKK